MSNLKKILALVLALVMSFSVMSVSSAAFKDAADFTANYEEAVDVLSALGVLKGYEDGTFKPQGNITRAEAAAIIYRIMTGDVTNAHVDLYAGYGKFADVAAKNWAAGYIGYCANGEYIKGYTMKGDGTDKFGPADPVTGYQMLAMLLRALGYGKYGEFVGEGWDIRVATMAEQLGLLNNMAVSHAALKAPASRELVCELAFSAMTKTNMVRKNLIRDYESTGVKLASYTFGLVELSGVIEAVGRTAGTTTLDNIVVKNTNTSWEKIGYLATVWAQKTPNAKTYTAITDVNVIGQSLKVSHNGSRYGSHGIVVEADADFYYNGVKLTAASVAAYNALVAEKTALVSQHGVKVDYIDNDFGGQAEAVVITDYTPDYVTGIANDKNAGTNAIVKNYTYFQDLGGVKTANIVCADTLAVGDLVTYVKYAGDYYTVKAPATIGTFTKINFSNITPADYSYVIGGNEYYKAYEFLGNAGLLTTGAIKKSLVVYTDPYGYALEVAENVAAAQYLYVVRTNHSDNVAGTTYATVVLADGTVQNVYVAKDNVNTFGEITAEMYTYTVKDGVYSLIDKCDAGVMAHAFDVDYANYYGETVTLVPGAFFTKASVVVDLRAVANRTGGTKVYTGYTEIPSLVDADFHYVADGNGFIKLAFLVDGTNDADLSKEFILYHTNYNYYEADATTGVVSYYIDAIVDGKIETIKLTAAQYADIQKHGVGYYDYASNGNLYYYSFVENFLDNNNDGNVDRNNTWSDVVWQNGTIKVDGIGYAYDDAIFFTLDIANGKAYDYIMTAGRDMSAAKACVFNKYNKVTEIYIIFGELASTEIEPLTEFGRNYYVQAGKVTNMIKTSDDLFALNNRLNAVKEETDAIEALVNEQGLSIMSVEMTFAEALARLAELKAELEDIVADIKAYIKEAATETAAEQAEALLTDAEDLTEVVAEAKPTVAVAAKLHAADVLNDSKATVEEKAAAQADLNAAEAALEEIGDDLDKDLADMIEDVEVEAVALEDLIAELTGKDFEGMTVEFVYDVEGDLSISEAFFAAMGEVVVNNEIIKSLWAVGEFEILPAYTGELPAAGETAEIELTLTFYIDDEEVKAVTFDGEVVNNSEVVEDEAPEEV